MCDRSGAAIAPDLYDTLPLWRPPAATVSGTLLIQAGTAAIRRRGRRIELVERAIDACTSIGNVRVRLPLTRIVVQTPRHLQVRNDRRQAGDAGTLVEVPSFLPQLEVIDVLLGENLREKRLPAGRSRHVRAEPGQCPCRIQLRQRGGGINGAIGRLRPDQEIFGRADISLLVIRSVTRRTHICLLYT